MTRILVAIISSALPKHLTIHTFNFLPAFASMRSKYCYFACLVLFFLRLVYSAS